MIKNVAYYILITFLGFYSNLSAQIKYEFEDTGINWTTATPKYWSVTNEKSFAGSYSLKFNSEKSYVDTGLYSFETGHTIQKVRTANFNSTNYIIGSSYDGIVMAIGFDGVILWKNKLSGYMVHDMWCADITGDGNDEILVTNADGILYCLDNKGKLLWQFQKNEVPMYAVTVVKKTGTPYVVCGSLDLNVYYVSSSGTLVKELKSNTYSQEKTWGVTDAADNAHYANFLRPLKVDNDNDKLIIHASNNHMQDVGALYFFDVLANTPIKRIETQSSSPIGELRFSDYDNDNNFEILLGGSDHQNSIGISRVNLIDDSTEQYPLSGLGFGYSVAQPELITDVDTEKYMILVGNQMVLVGTDLNSANQEKLVTKYSYNDMWKLAGTNKIVLASCQSGGSQIHILDTGHSNWKTAYQELIPEGKIKKIIDNTAQIRTNLASYVKPASQSNPVNIYFMTESTDDGLAKITADNIRNNYATPMFLGGSHMSQAEDWDRSSMTNEKYKNRRDGRRDYNLTQQGAINHITNWYNEVPQGDKGIAYWGGHGNDPYMFQLSTTQQILDAANGKKTVLIYPELEDHSADFAWVMEDLFYPLATYAQNKNGNIYVRTKHNFWQGNVYLPMWNRLLSGEFADVFVPSMEETTDKTMDISIASRVGVWASGSVNSWGTRTVPDNPSFDRSRQFSHQRLPNHFLRHLIYHMANGAQYINNFAVDPDYMSIVWDLVAKGALFVPQRNELLSISPVHLSMFNPDEHYMAEGSSLKWSTYYNEDFENNNPFVFSRQNATWMAAKVNNWDFSKYAGGVKDRRQNYLPSYPNGLVLITPPQIGAHADLTATRGALKDILHPIYNTILKEYYTDGRHYYSEDGIQKFDADQYYTTIENEIKQSAALLPLTVSGEVAWVVAQTSPTNLRLTIIDNGYLNPDDRKATVTFNTVTPVNMKDILDGTTYSTANPASVEVIIPAGTFRFIDIELASPL